MGKANWTPATATLSVAPGIASSVTLLFCVISQIFILVFILIDAQLYSTLLIHFPKFWNVNNQMYNIIIKCQKFYVFFLCLHSNNALGCICRVYNHAPINPPCPQFLLKNPTILKQSLLNWVYLCAGEAPATFV